VADLDYTPYGQAYTANDTIGITHRFTGHDWDATDNLYFAPYRSYNPQLARWMSRDPLGMVDGPNPYVYVSGTPTYRKDALGLWWHHPQETLPTPPGDPLSPCNVGFMACMGAGISGRQCTNCLRRCQGQG